MIIRLTKFRKATALCISFGLIVYSSCTDSGQSSFVHLGLVQSGYVDARKVDIWLPPSYYRDADKRYPVIYMHDGQNVFGPGTAFGGQGWGTDEWVTKLSADYQIPEIILVGIWNTPKRFREYNPREPFDSLPDSLRQILVSEYNGEPLSDDYLKFIVKELKPRIDSLYQTIPDPRNTLIMGSSMGGLISLYALAEYPDVFGAAGCLSTHWPISLQRVFPSISDAYIKYLSNKLPEPGRVRIYFDYGTGSLDSVYEPFQVKIDSLLLGLGYQEGYHFQSLKFEGHAHNEYYWNQRLDKPLIFLLGKQNKRDHHE